MGNSANIRDKGGNKIALVMLDNRLAIPHVITAGTNAMDLGNISDSKIKTNLKKSEFSSEDGVVRSTESAKTVVTEATLMERHKALMDFIAFNVTGNSYLEYRYAGIVNGMCQEYFSIVQPDAQINQETPGGAKSNKYSSTHIAPDSAITFAAADIAAINTALGTGIKTQQPVTINANQEYTLVETSTVQGS